MSVSAQVTAPAESNFQTLINDLQTVKTSFPNLTFSLAYENIGSV
jgi:hypothetical protein